MGEDVAFRAGAGIRVETMTQARAEERPGAAIHRARQDFPVRGEQGEQGGRVGRLPQAVKPGFGQADVALRQHGIEHRPVANLHDGVARAFAEALAQAAGQSQFQRPAAQAFEQAQRQGRIARHAGGGQGQGAVEHVHRVVSSNGGWGLEKKGTRLSHSRSACQWMRAITPSVIHG